MANYSIDREASGLITCRITAFLDDADGVAFANDVLAAVKADRRLGTNLKILFENRTGCVFSATALAALNNALQSTRQAGDRTAVLLANSLQKMQAKRNMTADDAVFISETAARLWLAC